MKKIKRIICISFFSLLIYSLSHATKPSMPSLKMDMRLEFSGPVEIDREVIVTFSFTPLEDVKRVSSFDDMANIVVDTNVVKILSGYPKWSGKLQKGKTEKITLLVKPAKTGFYNFSGIVNSGPVDMSKKSKNLEGQLPPEGVFLYKNVVGKSFKFGEPEVKEQVDSVILEGGTVIKSIPTLGPPPLISKIDTAEIRQDSFYYKPGTIKSKQDTPTEKPIPPKEFVFKVDTTKEASLSSVELTSINLQSGAMVVVGLKDKFSGNFVKAQWSLEPSDCGLIEPLPDRRIRLFYSNPTKSSKLRVLIKKTEYIINLNVLQNHTVSGTFSS